MKAKATVIGLLPIACGATRSPVDTDVAAAPGLTTDEGAGGTYELVGFRSKAVLLEARDGRLVSPVWVLPPHI
jgi:hypothetical protein